MAKVAIVYPLSLEPTGIVGNNPTGRLETYHQVETAFTTCAPLIKQNLLEKFQGHEVDIYVFANYENLTQAQLFKKQLMNLYPIKDFILEPWENVKNKIPKIMIIIKPSLIRLIFLLIVLSDINIFIHSIKKYYICEQLTLS